jgi:hypothetical protein
MKLIFTLATAVVLSGCAGVPERTNDTGAVSRYEAHAGEPVGRVSYRGRIHAWQPLGRDVLVLWTTAQQPYLVRVMPTCLNLEFATRISLSSRMGGWVSSGMDDIRVDGTSCRITEIRPIDAQALRAQE